MPPSSLQEGGSRLEIPISKLAPPPPFSPMGPLYKAEMPSYFPRAIFSSHSTFRSDLSHVPNRTQLSPHQPLWIVTDIRWAHHMQKCWGHKSFKRLNGGTESGTKVGIRKYGEWQRQKLFRFSIRLRNYQKWPEILSSGWAYLTQLSWQRLAYLSLWVPQGDKKIKKKNSGIEIVISNIFISTCTSLEEALSDRVTILLEVRWRRGFTGKRPHFLACKSLTSWFHRTLLVSLLVFELQLTPWDS